MLVSCLLERARALILTDLARNEDSYFEPPLEPSGPTSDISKNLDGTKLRGRIIRGIRARDFASADPITEPRKRVTSHFKTKYHDCCGYMQGETSLTRGTVL